MAVTRNGFYSETTICRILDALPADCELTVREAHRAAGNYHSISTTRGILNLLASRGLANKRAVPTHRGPAGSVVNVYSRTTDAPALVPQKQTELEPTS
jgi:hypothetical protein